MSDGGTLTLYIYYNLKWNSAVPLWHTSFNDIKNISFVKKYTAYADLFRQIIASGVLPSEILSLWWLPRNYVTYKTLSAPRLSYMKEKVGRPSETDSIKSKISSKASRGRKDGTKTPS